MLWASAEWTWKRVVCRVQTGFIQASLAKDVVAFGVAGFEAEVETDAAAEIGVIVLGFGSCWRWWRVLALVVDLLFGLWLIPFTRRHI